MNGFGQILEDLNETGVEYVLIGGIAMIRHGVVRATRDIDAVFDPSEENVTRIRDLINRWKATRPDGSPVRINEIGPDRTIHLATPHGDLDLLSQKIAGIPYARLRKRADVKRVDGVRADLFPRRPGRPEARHWARSRYRRPFRPRSGPRRPTYGRFLTKRLRLVCRS